MRFGDETRLVSELHEARLSHDKWEDAHFLGLIIDHIPQIV